MRRMERLVTGYYKIPSAIREDIRALERQIQQFKEGKVARGKFRGFRVPLGIYEQRQADTYMMRIRIPGGGITSAQLAAVAEIATEFGVKIHITTRQDIQLQNASIDDLAPIYWRLNKEGMTCKGGGGNTVRNITACAEAGICQKEAFNVLPNVIGLTEYMIQFPSSFNLPRKYKIAFSGCGDDCALATVNDLGFIAKVRDGENGFSVYVAGGMGADSRVALPIYDFLPMSEVGYVAEAVKRVFDRHGDRKRKHRARLRFVLERFGPEKFVDEVTKAIQAVKEEGPIELEVPQLNEGEGREARLPNEPAVDAGYESWLERQVKRQRQSGFCSVNIPVPLGDVEPSLLLGLAKLTAEADVSLRTTHAQDLLLHWVREEELPALFNRLRALDLTDPEHLNINRLVCCKGAATCKLGLCLSQGLAKAIAQQFDADAIDLIKMPDINLQVNGCPNACGQHPVGALGLSGGARRAGGRLAPHYNVSIGGRALEGDTKLGDPLGHIPARSIPKLLAEFLKSYEAEGSAYQGFLQFADTKGSSLLKSLVEKYKTMPTFEDHPEYYHDWSSEEEFSLAGRGPGECGAGVWDMIEADLEEAKIAYEAFTENKDYDELYRGLVHLAKSLLVTRGLDPKDDLEALAQFGENFVDSGWVHPRYKSLLEAAHDYQKNGDTTKLMDTQGLTKGLAERLKELYESLDSNLQFQVEAEQEPAEASEEEAQDAKMMDLRGVPCPINYVRAKVALEDMEIGDLLELLLDDGEPIGNVPPSLENDGQEILEVRKVNGHFYLKVKKRN